MQSDDEGSGNGGATMQAAAAEAPKAKAAAAGRKKTKRAPNAPLAAKSAYMCFCQDQRPAAKAALGEDAKATEVLKRLGAMWQALGEEARGKYVEMAAEDKIRYANEMSNYDGPLKVPAKRPAKKDPNAPPAAKTAFNFYQMEARDGMKLRHPEAGANDISRLVAAAWRELTPAQKLEYDEKAKNDKDRVAQELLVYHANGGRPAT
ncbi:high mobility group box domain-containing protein [Tribonema minus]|uniref:High mobility group box domain-containing protein n=1 Tax=Tribonema minus TaxID=303371 RepID=A0A835Z2K0_9STRA|nr:high mobility group box domain-containing protein [Tribonema minus]